MVTKVYKVIKDHRVFHLKDREVIKGHRDHKVIKVSKVSKVLLVVEEYREMLTPFKDRKVIRVLLEPKVRKVLLVYHQQVETKDTKDLRVLSVTEGLPDMVDQVETEVLQDQVGQQDHKEIVGVPVV